MVSYKGHIGVGLVFAGILTAVLFLIEMSELNTLLGLQLNWLWYPSLFGLPAWVYVLFVTVHGSIAPDIDIQTSKAFKWTTIGLLLLMLLMLAQGTITGVVSMIILAAYLMFCFWCKHRGFTHTPLFAIMYATVILLVFQFDWVIAAYAFLAVIYHLIMDR